MRIKTYGCVDRCPISTRYIGISSIVFDQNSIKLSAFPRGKRGGMTDDVRSSEWRLKCRNLMMLRHVSAPIRQIKQQKL